MKTRHSRLIVLASLLSGIIGSVGAQVPSPMQPRDIEAAKAKYADVIASMQRRSSLPVGAEARFRPGKEWQVWTAYYASLKHINERSPSKLQTLFEKHGVGRENVEAVLDAGDTFARSIDDVNETSRAEINARFGVKRRPVTAVSGNSLAGIVERPPPTPPVVLQKKSSLSLTETLDNDGTSRRYDDQLTAAVNKNRQQLRKVLGASAAKNLEDWVNTEVAPKVREVVQAGARTAPVDSPATVGNSTNVIGR